MLKVKSEQLKLPSFFSTSVIYKLSTSLSISTGEINNKANNLCICEMLCVSCNGIYNNSIFDYAFFGIYLRIIQISVGKVVCFESMLTIFHQICEKKIISQCQ